MGQLLGTGITLLILPLICTLFLDLVGQSREFGDWGSRGTPLTYRYLGWLSRMAIPLIRQLLIIAVQAVALLLAFAVGLGGRAVQEANKYRDRREHSY